MSNYEIELQVQGSPSGELTQQVDGEPGGGSVSAREAEAWARGTRAGTAVSSDDPTYHNNSKYYAEQAHDAAESASAAYGTNLLAPTFDASQAYPAGAHVIHDDGYYVLPEGHTAGDTWAETSKTQQTVGGEVTGLKSAKADKDGTHEDLTAGNALYLLSDRGDTDVAPYVFRKTGGAKKAYGREFLRKIVGGTVAWNQLAASNSEVFPANENRNSGIASFTGIVGHKYIFAATQENSITSNIRNMFVITWNNSAHTDYETGALENANLTKGTRFVMFSCPEGGSSAFRVWVHTPNVDVTYDKPMIFDLTQMFGSTIADAIYAMEQATAGSGVAWFRSLFPKDYYAYDAGSLQSVQAKEHRLTGFNQWDEDLVNGKYWGVDNSNALTQYSHAERSCTNNPIRVLPGETYYVKSPNGYRAFFGDKDNKMVSESGWKDANTTVIVPANAVCMVITFNPNIGTYNHDICINISDPSRNGTYEPYSGHTYPLDSSLTLRGIPKWDSTNGLYYDGDEYKPDGSVKRKYGIVDLGTLDWTLYSFAGNDVFYANIPTRVGLGYCLQAKYNRVENVLPSNMENKSFLDAYNTTYIYIKDDSYTDVATFKTAMSGVYLVYEIAIPTTEQAEPYRELQISAHGGTEEFIDAGVTATTPTRDVSVPVGTETFYPIDVVAYIEELTNPDHDMVADALIPSGKYFMVGNSLYKSTSQIQAGATIIPGSNCTAKTLAEALNELNT